VNKTVIVFVPSVSAKAFELAPELTVAPFIVIRAVVSEEVGVN